MSSQMPGAGGWPMQPKQMLESDYCLFFPGVQAVNEALSFLRSHPAMAPGHGPMPGKCPVRPKEVPKRCNSPRLKASPSSGRRSSRPSERRSRAWASSRRGRSGPMPPWAHVRRFGAHPYCMRAYTRHGRTCAGWRWARGRAHTWCWICWAWRHGCGNGCGHGWRGRRRLGCQAAGSLASVERTELRKFPVSLRAPPAPPGKSTAARKENACGVHLVLLLSKPGAHSLRNARHRGPAGGLATAHQVYASASVLDSRDNERKIVEKGAGSFHRRSDAVKIKTGVKRQKLSTNQSVADANIAIQES